MEILHFEDLGDTRVLFGCEHSSSSAWRVSNLIAKILPIPCQNGDKQKRRHAFNLNGDAWNTETATIN